MSPVVFLKAFFFEKNRFWAGSAKSFATTPHRPAQNKEKKSNRIVGKVFRVFSSEKTQGDIWRCLDTTPWGDGSMDGWVKYSILFRNRKKKSY
jgi:hypothetical protein